MRQYYDLACLLQDADVLKFIGTDQYLKHKEARFPKEDIKIPIKYNQAFLLEDENIRKDFITRYEETAGLYNAAQTPLEDLLEIIKFHLDKL